MKWISVEKNLQTDIFMAQEIADWFPQQDPICIQKIHQKGSRIKDYPHKI